MALCSYQTCQGGSSDLARSSSPKRQQKRSSVVAAESTWLAAPSALLFRCVVIRLIEAGIALGVVLTVLLSERAQNIAQSNSQILAIVATGAVFLLIEVGHKWFRERKAIAEGKEAVKQLAGDRVDLQAAHAELERTLTTEREKLQADRAQIDRERNETVASRETAEQAAVAAQTELAAEIERHNAHRHQTSEALADLRHERQRAIDKGEATGARLDQMRTYAERATVVARDLGVHVRHAILLDEPWPLYPGPRPTLHMVIDRRGMHTLYQLRSLGTALNEDADSVAPHISRLAHAEVNDLAVAIRDAFRVHPSGPAINPVVELWHALVGLEQADLPHEISQQGQKLSEMVHGREFAFDPPEQTLEHVRGVVDTAAKFTVELVEWAKSAADRLDRPEGALWVDENLPQVRNDLAAAETLEIPSDG